MMMQFSLRQAIQSNPALKWWLPLMLLVQLVFSYNAVGFFHPDQHFQIIEFAQYHLHNANGTAPIWELKAMIRPSLQIHLFAWYYLFCQFLGVVNPFTQLTILQVITGVAMFVLFTAITLYYLRKQSNQVQVIALLLLHLSWAFPYIRSLFSSEVLSAFLFFLALYYFDRQKEKYNPLAWNVTIVTGLLFGFAFYARFQMGLAVAGWGLWLLIAEKRIPVFVGVALGFCIAILINVYLDYLFYHQWLFTPYKYFTVNITGGVANSFGTSSFLNYIAILAAIVSAPLLSVVFFVMALVAVVKNLKHSLSLSVLFFVVGHCFVGHKEERFLFPIVFTMPVFIGWQLQWFINYWQQGKGIGKWLMKFSTCMGLVLNLFLLIVFLFTPYAQTVHFARSLQAYYQGKTTTVHCIHRSPLETESTLPLTFYQKALPDLHFEKIESKAAFDSLPIKPNLLAVTFNDIAEKRTALQTMGYEPVFYSSNMLWNINCFLATKHINTINDIWVLYRLKK